MPHKKASSFSSSTSQLIDSESEAYSELANESPGLSESNGASEPSPSSSPFFARRSILDQRCLNIVVTKIRKDLCVSERPPGGSGILYVAKQCGGDMVKIGFSKDDNNTRIDAISKRCGLQVEKSYRTGTVMAAHRAEQIVHELLVSHAYVRYFCDCQKENKEWYLGSFNYLMEQVSIVHAWMSKQPYDLKTGQLKKDWAHGLKILKESQSTESPLSWTEFFLMGASLQLPPPSPRLSPGYHSHSSPSLPQHLDTHLPSSASRGRGGSSRGSGRQPPLIHANSSPASLEDPQYLDIPSPSQVSRGQRRSSGRGGRPPRMNHADSSPATLKDSSHANRLQHQRSSSPVDSPSTPRVKVHPADMRMNQEPAVLPNWSPAVTRDEQIHLASLRNPSTDTDDKELQGYKYASEEEELEEDDEEELYGERGSAEDNVSPGHHNKPLRETKILSDNKVFRGVRSELFSDHRKTRVGSSSEDGKPMPELRREVEEPTRRNAVLWSGDTTMKSLSQEMQGLRVAEEDQGGNARGRRRRVSSNKTLDDNTAPSSPLCQDPSQARLPRRNLPKR